MKQPTASIMSPNILVGLPCYTGEFKAGCVMSLLALENRLTLERIPHTNRMLGRNGIEEVRNILGSLMLQDSQFTHLLQVDYDTAFRPEAFLRMLMENTEVIGCNYVGRDPATFERAFEKRDMGFHKALSASAAYTAHFEAGEIAIANGVASGKDATMGMGLTLIKREAFERMRDSDTLRVNNSGEYSKHHQLHGPLYGFFDKIAKSDGSLYGEDISFCRRWHQLGGHVKVVIDEDIGHIGEITYRGRISDFISA